MEMRLPFAHHSFQPCSHFMSCHRMLQSLLFRWAAATLHCSRCCSRLYVAKQEIAQTDGFFLSWSGKVLFFEILTVFFGLGEWVVGGVWGWWQQSFDSPGQHFWGGGHPTNSIKDLLWLYFHHWFGCQLNLSGECQCHVVCVIRVNVISLIFFPNALVYDPCKVQQTNLIILAGLYISQKCKL